MYCQQAPSTDTLPKRNFDYDFDAASLQDVHQKRHISAFGTPRVIRRTSHSATLPRRSLKKSSLYNVSCDKDAISRISSQTSVAPNSPNDGCATPRTSSHSSITSSKTVVSKEHLKRASPTHKSLSSASSGYNSLPRSACSSLRNAKASSASSRSSVKLKPSKSKDRPENSITFHVSAKSSTGFEGDGSSSSPQTETSATTMTTTINSGNKTKIFLQQHNTPTRSLITFENSVDDQSCEKPDIIIMNQPYSCKNESKENKKPARPTSLYAEQNNLLKSNKQSAKLLESQLRMKYPSTETIQLEEKSLETAGADKQNNNKSNNVNVLDDLSACKNTGLKNANLFGFSSENELNNAKNYLLNLNSNVDKINNLRNKNLLSNSKDEELKFRDSVNSEPASPHVEHSSINKFNDLKKSNELRIEKELESLNLDDARLKSYPDFPSLTDLSLRFTSLAAQSILKGVSYNSVDTLVEVNMAAEKKRNCEMSISTDLGVV